MSSTDLQPCRLIVNTDDLGLHEDIYRGIEQAHRQGIVTSTSVVACGEAFDHAVEILRTCPNLDVGVHLTLVGGERPLCPPEEVPSLVGADGRFAASYRQFAMFRTWAVSPNQIRRELDAQIQRVMKAGIKPSHLDSHQHVHVFPSVRNVVRELAREHGIRWIRTPRFDSLFEARRSLLDPFFRFGLNTLSAVSSYLPDGEEPIQTIGLDLSGRLTEDDLSRLITGLRPGIYELVTHPGVTTPSLVARYPWDFAWSEELAALISPRIVSDLQAAGVQRIRFSEA